MHIFNTQFYTSMVDNGVDHVLKWTEKKLDVFTKKLLILPIHKQLHWSLCCVGNTSAVTNSSDEEDEDLEVSYTLFLNPLDYHDRSKVCQQVREWLNGEWNRKNKTSIHMLTPLTMKCFSTKGKIICITLFPILSNMILILM
jgi:Ulp1 family protease